MKITDEAVGVAARKLFDVEWVEGDWYWEQYPEPNRWQLLAQEALEAAVPYFTPDREAIYDAVGEVWPWDDSDEQARDLRNDVVDAVLALLNGPQVTPGAALVGCKANGRMVQP